MEQPWQSHADEHGSRLWDFQEESERTVLDTGNVIAHSHLILRLALLTESRLHECGGTPGAGKDSLLHPEQCLSL